MRTMFFAPYVLSEVVTGVVWRQILRPNGLLDQTLDGVGARWLVQGWLADPDVVLYSLFFVISWKYFGFHMILMLAGLQQIPTRAQRGRLDRRCLGMADVPLHHVAAARCRRCACRCSCRSSVRCSCSTWSGSPPRAARSAPRRRWRRTSTTGSATACSATPSAVSIVIFGFSLVVALFYQRFALRRDLEGPASVAERRRPSGCARRRRSPCARIERAADVTVGLYVVAFVTLAIIVIPLTFSVFGGFRDQPTARRRAGRPPRPVGVGELLHAAPIGQVLAPGLQQHVDRAADHGRRAPGGIAGRVRAGPLPVPRVASWSTACSRSGCCSRSRSRSCRCSSCCARSVCSVNPLGVALPQAAFGLPISIIIMRPFFRAIPQAAAGRGARSTGAVRSASTGR